MVLQRLPLEAFVRCQRIGVAWRAMVAELSHGGVALLGAIPELRAEASRGQLDQTTMCTALGMTPRLLRMHPHTTESRRGAPMYNSKAVVHGLVAGRVGWDGLAAMLNRKVSKKRARDGLEDRRTAACAKRRARFDDWLGRDAPLGSRVASLEDWTRECAGASVAIARDATLHKFLLGSVLTAPSLVAAKAAAVSLHELLRAQAVEAAEAAKARKERADTLRAALAALGLERRNDSRLSDAFEEGAPLHGFQTAEAVASEMALMRYLHEYTDYSNELEWEVERLHEQEGHFYRGIYGDARTRVKAKFTRRGAVPLQWPWLE